MDKLKIVSVSTCPYLFWTSMDSHGHSWTLMDKIPTMSMIVHGCPRMSKDVQKNVARLSNSIVKITDTQEKDMT